MPDNWKANIDNMNHCLIHRGPDGGGVWCDENASVVLGHRRLSILDLSVAGQQPMVSRNGRYILVYNGEIYNHDQLKKRIVKDSLLTDFRGHSDTEILLEYIAAYGLQEMLVDSKGMFSLAVYDRELRKLYLARDRIGEKPLYYGFIGGGVHICF